jgi:hypothetical protein
MLNPYFFYGIKLEIKEILLPMLIKSEHYIFHTITKTAYIFGVLSHIGIGFVFVWMNVYEMVLFNFILSVPIFIVCFITSRQGKHNLAFSLAFFELLFHQIAGVYFLGWESGFQYFLFYLSGLTFFNAAGTIRFEYFQFQLFFPVSFPFICSSEFLRPTI